MSDQQQARTLNGVVAYLTPSNAAEAVAFYEKAFAAEVRDKRPTEDGRLMHCELAINGGAMMLSDAFPEHGYPAMTPQGVMMMINVDDPQAWWERAVEAGCEITMPMEVQFWGDRFGQLRDPFGFSWAINGPASAA